MTLRGTCHCGAVQLAIPRAPEKATLCNCSICRRYGAIWGYFLPGEVTVTAAPDAMQGYAWGDKSIRFARCANCGCMTHYELLQPQGDDDTMAVNIRMFVPQEIGDVRLRRFDGAHTWRYLDE